jgi:glycogen debranching enzyme
MININLNDLLEDAKKTLEGNWNGKFTIPSATLYPHQWSWDTAFISIGNSYINTERAIKDLKYLFNAQWKNGMIPHIIFNDKETTYFPAADFYNVNRCPNAPNNIGTSGMTQPPMHAIASYYIHKNSQNKKRSLEFLKWIFPKLINFHRYLMTERDPEKSGLVTIFHPWESGLDDSPTWDDALSRIKIQHLITFKRLDVIAVEGAKDTIPTDDMYNKFIYLIELMKQYNYDENEMYKSFPFKIKAIVFSSILYVANKYLIKIANILEEKNNINEINQWIYRTEQHFFKYFFPLDNQRRIGQTEEALFYNYDLVSKNWITKKTISSFIPLYTGLIPKDDIDKMVKWIQTAHWCGDGKFHTLALPSTDTAEQYFKEKRYWRGPIWINANWFIYLGLIKYGYTEFANHIREGIFELVANHGFREYYDPFTGEGLGGKSFSWTAALVIDMIKNKKMEIDID